MIDVDWSYLARKHQQLQVDGVNVAPLGIPSVPPSGWNAMTETDCKEAVEKMPKLTSGNQQEIIILGVAIIIISLPFHQVPYIHI